MPLERVIQGSFSWCVIRWFYFPWNVGLGNYSSWLVTWGFYVIREEPEFYLLIFMIRENEINIRDPWSSTFFSVSAPYQRPPVRRSLERVAKVAYQSRIKPNFANVSPIKDNFFSPITRHVKKSKCHRQFYFLNPISVVKRRILPIQPQKCIGANPLRKW